MTAVSGLPYFTPCRSSAKPRKMDTSGTEAGLVSGLPFAIDWSTTLSDQRMVVQLGLVFFVERVGCP